MGDIAIKVENVSKYYNIGDTSSGSLRETISNFFSSKKKQQEEEFWALKDISFEVKKGEAVGIIGKNGAGKSTLLKILSRITDPTTGRIEINGRISSLLEVGTGFHPELTGRENVFLNGTILGMSRAEVKAKFDEIVDFSGVEKFLDTPVKRYSSGMKVRLAFAVAAHLEPEILIIDEVLAVGDAEFQKKCLGKMEDVAGQGRTIIFVSHNMHAVKQLCTRGVLLNHGVSESIGEINDIINLYLEKNQAQSQGELAKFEIDPSKDFQLLEAQIMDEKLNQKSIFECEEDIHLMLKCRLEKPIPGLYGYLTIKDKNDNLYIETDTFDNLPNVLEELSEGITEINITIPKRLLSPGHYYIYLNFTSKQNIDGFHVDSPGNILSFDMIDSYTVRGNKRKSFLGTTLKWNLSHKKVHS
ncbi:ABC transporter ATP-binding protein [Catalinimonas niigatensis]|uniref:ABC transporter ATP-binding protein n=1 Tax=Catalinimonas niigatensis TaxID=1397264 RepID=UPI002665CFE7|nr:ABC transporter ATP-binding protein [Catalinimonas niigatensis]WPP53305.1 ABC transporter ATP-binding protein [Catalinimonas niigatensis]